MPGPGWYRAEQRSEKFKYSMRPKTNKELFRILQNPGPGAYNDPGIKADGHYMLAKYPRIRGPSFIEECVKRPKKYDRIPAPSQYAPGPGWYESAKQFNMSDIMSSSVMKSRGQALGYS